MSHFEKKLSGETIYSGKVITVEKDEVELENKAVASREVVRHNGGVAVLAIDDEDNVLFVRQFRYPYSEVLLELPAGKLDKGEDAAQCGLRELKEETGYTASEYDFLAKVYPTPGYTDEILYIYTAKGLEYTKQALDEDEFLTVEKIPYGEAINLCLNGGIKDAKTLIGLLLYNTKKGYDN